MSWARLACNLGSDAFSGGVSRARVLVSLCVCLSLCVCVCTFALAGCFTSWWRVIRVWELWLERGSCLVLLVSGTWFKPAGLRRVAVVSVSPSRVSALYSQIDGFSGGVFAGGAHR